MYVCGDRGDRPRVNKLPVLCGAHNVYNANFSMNIKEQMLFWEVIDILLSFLISMISILKI